MSAKEYEMIKLPRLTMPIDDFNEETIKRRYTDSVYPPTHHNGVWQELIVQILIPLLLLALPACSGGENRARDATGTALAAVTATHTATVTATLPPTATATHTPTMTPTLTPTPLPTDTPTPTATPSITPTPTPDPIVEYLGLIWEFLEGSNTIKNVIFEDSISDETLATYEALLETVTQTGEAILDDEDMLPSLRPLIVETVEVCSRANEAWMSVARTANESGKTVTSSIIGTDEYWENFSAVADCANVLTPQLIEAIRGE
jgi:hypothetical protein